MDPISDMLIRIKNAQKAKKQAVSFGYSNIKYEIAKLLASEGFVADAQKKGKKSARLLELKLLYDGSDPKITGLKRISKLSRRVYRGYKQIFPVRRGAGAAIYSTTSGLLTDREARKRKIGGEALFEIW